MSRPILRLSLPRVPGQSTTDHRTQNAILRETIRGKVPPVNEGETLSADRLRQRTATDLKRRAAVVCERVRNCVPAALPATLDNLRDVAAFIALAIRLRIVPPGEGELSGRQLLHPVTLTDWLSALEITRQMHRPPAHVTPHEGLAEQVNRKLDIIAALLGGNPDAPAAWAEVASEESEVEL